MYLNQILFCKDTATISWHPFIVCFLVFLFESLMMIERDKKKLQRNSFIDSLSYKINFFIGKLTHSPNGF